MMRDGDGWAALIVFALLFLIALGAVWLEKESCYRRFEDSGMGVRWSLVGECQVEVEDEKWIPADLYYYREEAP